MQNNDLPDKLLYFSLYKSTPAGSRTRTGLRVKPSEPEIETCFSTDPLADHFCPDVTKTYCLSSSWKEELPLRSGKWEGQESNLPKIKRKKIHTEWRKCTNHRWGTHKSEEKNVSLPQTLLYSYMGVLFERERPFVYFLSFLPKVTPVWFENERWNLLLVLSHRKGSSLALSSMAR